jgi:coenzyme F420-reducing hydrogenase beta subunit
MKNITFKDGSIVSDVRKIEFEDGEFWVYFQSGSPLPCHPRNVKKVW